LIEDRVRTMRRRVLIVVVGLGLVAAAWLGIGAWQFRMELWQARRELASRHVVQAKARLDRLAERWPGRGEVEYWLGACERAAGHTDAALAAWGRVPDTAPVARLAALERGRLALESYHYALAESCLERAIPGGGEIGDEARRLLAQLHTVTGRHDDLRRYMRREVERQDDPTENLLTLWQIDHMPYPIERSRRELERARAAAPDDDRVWLALADLATRTGRFEEAEAWLTRCEQARPDDPVVWRARLDWAQAADRPDEAVRAVHHLPVSLFTRPRAVELRAWMAARRGDRGEERAALELKLALEPGDSAAVERLADLAAQDGDRERLASLRRQKAAIDAARVRYQSLVRIPDLTTHIPELARAAEASGRRFDAKAWWALAARRDRSITAEAHAALARLATAEPAPEHGERTLADLLGPLEPRGQAETAVTGTLDIPAFTDDAERRGVLFTFDNGHSELYQLPETFGGGVAVLDFDGDGWLDIYAMQGGPFPPRRDPPPFGDRLFRNRGDGRFDDATARSGLGARKGGYGFGVAVGDFDNDGRPDIFVTRWRGYALYHNLGDGRFEDVTARAGLGGDRDWPSSAVWADLDNDGDLDLYVCHYLKWDDANPPLCTHSQGRVNGYCDPRLLPSLPDHVFRNDGGRFSDVTEQAGIVDREGRGLGVVAADLDDDGRVDLFVANDTTANYFFRNHGGFRFSEEGTESGLAGSASGSNLAGMGVACGDFDGDGRLDLAVTNYLGESTTLYHNHGGGRFSDRAAAAALAAPTRFVLGFGLAALDANNDGRLDLAQANGHVDDYRPTVPYLMPAQLFLGNGAGKLVDVSDRAGPPWRLPRLGRGLAVGDLDNDGRTDVIIVAQNAPLALLYNQSASRNHFLTLALEGTASNRDAVGARVAVTVLGKTQVAARLGGGSYLSASDHRLHFGLGPAQKVDRVEVTWPTGRRDSYGGLAADAGYRLREGDAAPRPLPGFASSAIKR
jgi:tetratricopeptide (TPR) repeat protein